MKTNSQLIHLINENNILKKQINEMKKQFKFCADCNLEKPINQFKCTRKNPKIRVVNCIECGIIRVEKANASNAK